jgi:hypothetical protein
VYPPRELWVSVLFFFLSPSHTEHEASSFLLYYVFLALIYYLAIGPKVMEPINHGPKLPKLRVKTNLFYLYKLIYLGI